MRTSLIANSLGAELRINAQGHADNLKSLIGHEFWPRFVPGAKLEVTNPKNNPDLNINIDPEAGWLFDTDSTDLTCPPGYILNAICAAGYMLEAKRQTMGHYTLHGNIIASSHATVALVGPISGIGKTGLSSRAVDRGWQWISDEKFVMNDQGEYMGSIEGVLGDAKTKKSAGDKGPVETEPSRRKIGAFVIPITTDSETLTSHAYDHKKAFWHLCEEMSRDVRLTPSALDGPETPLPSFDSEEIAIKRRKVAAILSNQIPYLFIMGTEDSILNHLSQTIR